MQNQIDELNKSLNTCKTEVGREVQSLSDELDEIKSDIKELLSIFKATKGFFKISTWIVKGFLIISAIAAGIIAISKFIKEF